MTTIGERVRAALHEAGMTQSTLARSISLSESALSKSLSGTRAFSSLELALTAEILDVSMYELVTGEPDPYQIRAAARHSYDADLGSYSSSLLDDRQALKDIALVYRQAFAS